MVSLSLLSDPARLKLRDRLLDAFVEWCDLEFKIELYDYQVEEARELLGSLVVEPCDVFIKQTRQSGKTELVTLLVRFLVIFFEALTGVPLMAGFASPKGEQAKTDVDRIKKSIVKLREGYQVEDREFNTKTIRAYRFERLTAEIFTFSLSPTTQNESKTLNLLIVEESHNADDQRRSDQLDPMLASTNGVTWMFGVGCTVLCDFKRGCDGQRPGSKSIIVPVDRVIADRRKKYEETGDPIHLNYEHTYLHDLGWPVVLAEFGTKKPAFRDFLTRLMARKELLYRMERCPFNVAVHLGVAGVVVIDKDAASDRTGTRREAYKWERKHGVFDSSPLSVVTAMGIHSYYRLPKEVHEVRSRIRLLGLPLDVLMGPRVATFPPSFVTATEHRYVIKSGKRVVAPSELPLLPESVVEQLNQDTRAKIELSMNRGTAVGRIRDPKAYCLRIESHQGANGSAGLIRAVCVLRDEGFASQEIFEFLTTVWNQPPRVTPPWSAGEIQRAITRHCGG